MSRIILAFGILLVMLFPIVVGAHSGGTDSSGGHWDRKKGTYHYHNSGSKKSSKSKTKLTVKSEPDYPLSIVLYINDEKVYAGAEVRENDRGYAILGNMAMAMGIK